MTKRKNIKRKPQGRNKSSKQDSSKKITAPTEIFQNESVLSYILNSLIIVYFLFYIFQIYSSLHETYFWADENKHAYICSLISNTYQIPTVLPEELYGGFKWSYPPLFHILGALFIGAAGFSALKFFNLMLLLIFLTSLYALIRKYYGQNEAVIAFLLATLSPVLVVNTLRFTTEILTMLLIFYSFFFILLALKREEKIFAISSAIATGLLMLTKQVGIVFLSFYFLLLIWFLWKNKKSSKIMLYVVGISVGIYFSYLVWVVYHKIEVYNFLSFFLGFGSKPEWASKGVISFRRYDSSLKEFAYLFFKGYGFVITFSLLLPVYHFIRSRAKDAPQNYIFVLSIYIALIMIIWHITTARHIIMLLPLIAFLCGYALPQIISNKIAIKAVILVLLIIAGYSAYHMPDHRKKYNAPQEFIKLAEIIEKNNTSSAKTLCIYKFDILMYTRKPVIWPHPKLHDAPIELVQKQKADKLYSLLKKFQIKYILIDTRRIIKSDAFQSRTYPLYFVRTCQQLERQGKVALEAFSKGGQFILLKVI